MCRFCLKIQNSGTTLDESPLHWDQIKLFIYLLIVQLISLQLIAGWLYSNQTCRYAHFIPASIVASSTAFDQ